MSEKKYTRTDDKKLGKMLLIMLDGATIEELSEITGSQATAYRYLGVLKDVYHVVVSVIEGKHFVKDIGNENIWIIVYKSLPKV